MIENNNDFVEMFEQKLCEITGAPYAVAVDCCTNAIFLAIKYKEHKVDFWTWPRSFSIPKHTYQSVPMVLMNSGYGVNFTEEKWEGKYQIGETGVWDCAVGFTPNMYEKGTFQCLSFQQKKKLSLGRGGAILLDDEEAYKRLKRMRHDGRDSSMGVTSEIANFPDEIIMGYHMYMTPDIAAKGVLLLNQMGIDKTVRGWDDYPDISVLRVFNAQFRTFINGE